MNKIYANLYQNSGLLKSRYIYRGFGFWSRKSSIGGDSDSGLKVNDKKSLAFYSLDPDHKNPSKHMPILMYHHLLTSKDMYQNVVKQLAQQTGRTVYLLDMRNHGESGHSDADLSDLNFMAKDVIDFMDEFQIDKAVLVGHGVGSQAMLRAALLHNDRVDRVAAFDIMPIDLPLFGISLMDRMEFIIASLPQHINKSFARLIVKQQLSLYFKDKSILQFILMNLMVDDNGYIKWRFNLPAIREAITKGIDRSANSDKQYSGDVLVVSGRYGSITANTYTQLKQWFPNAKFDFYKKYRHFVSSTNKSKQFLNILLPFLSEGNKKLN